MTLVVRTMMALAALTTGAAWAHPGHGDANPVHWHAFDAWGWALALAAGGAAAWWARRK